MSTAIKTTTKTVTRDVDKELMEARKIQSKRQAELHSEQQQRKMKSKVENCCCENLQVLKYILIALAIFGSLFGSILLVIAGDPPYNQDTLYQYGDLMRIVTDVNHNLIEFHERNETETDGNIRFQRRDTRARFKEIFNNFNWMEKENFGSNLLKKFLNKWWNVKKADFDSDDPILSDANFFWKNYTTYQTGFIILVLVSNFLLLLTWIFFKILKNFRKSKFKKEAEQVESTKGNFINQQFKQIQQFKNFKKTKISHRMVFFIILFQLALIFILMIRPNLLAIVVHQVSFLLLAVSSLASTSMASFKKKYLNYFGKQNGSPSNLKMVTKQPISKSHQTSVNIPSASVSQPQLLSSMKPSHQLRSQINSPLQDNLPEESIRVYTSQASKHIKFNYPDEKNPFEINKEDLNEINVPTVSIKHGELRSPGSFKIDEKISQGASKLLKTGEKIIEPVSDAMNFEGKVTLNPLPTISNIDETITESTSRIVKTGEKITENSSKFFTKTSEKITEGASKIFETGERIADNSSKILIKTGEKITDGSSRLLKTGEKIIEHASDALTFDEKDRKSPTILRIDEKVLEGSPTILKIDEKSLERSPAILKIDEKVLERSPTAILKIDEKIIEKSPIVVEVKRKNSGGTETKPEPVCSVCSSGLK